MSWPCGLVVFRPSVLEAAEAGACLMLSSTLSTSRVLRAQAVEVRNHEGVAGEQPLHQPLQLSAVATGT
jgi:hypothetical protein